MGILNIRPATRAGAKLVIGVAGTSGSGKTYSALLMGRGMVSHPSKLGFLCTENRRGSLYADKLDGQFMIADLFYPFTPARYKKAIQEFQDAGVEVLIVDSVSHEWESGCQEIAEAPLLNGKAMADWKRAKAEHKKFMTSLLQSDMHIICCIRAAEKMDFRNPKKPVSLGIQPLCEKNFMFEMTASVMMFNEGLNQQHLKIPADLKPIFGDGNGYLGIETGQAIIAWANQGDINQELESWRNKIQLAASDGTQAMGEAWALMPDHIKQQLEPQKRPIYESAKAVDDMRAEEAKLQNASEPQEQQRPTSGFNAAAVQVNQHTAEQHQQPSQPKQVDQPQTNEQVIEGF